MKVSPETYLENVEDEKISFTALRMVKMDPWSCWQPTWETRTVVLSGRYQVLIIRWALGSSSD